MIRSRWRSPTLWGGVVLLAATTAVVLPRGSPNAAELMTVGLLAVAVAATASAGPRALLLAVATVCLAATLVGTQPDATLRERDLAVGLMPAALPFAVASLQSRRWPTVLACVGGLLAGPVRMLVYDPFLDPSCQGCAPGQLVLVPSPGLAEVLHPLGVWIAVAAGVWGLRRGPVELWGVVATLLIYASGTARVEAVVAGCALAASALGRALVTSYRRRARLDELVRSLEASDQVPDSSDLDELAAVDDAVAGLVLENRRLTARLRTQVTRLAAARAAVVRVTAAERRTLERDLHDGVQQHLLALGMDLRIALAACRPAARPCLEQALEHVVAALDDVREISHGAHPPLLATRGLAAAATYLRRRHGSLVALHVPPGRYDASVEEAAYEVLADAIRRGARSATVVEGDGLRVFVEGVMPPDVRLYDMVGALGGWVRVAEDRLEAVIPCG